MSNGIYERRQMAVEDFSKRGSRTWGLIGVAAVLLSIGAAIQFVNKDRAEKKAAAQAVYEAAVSKAPVEIESAFKNWTAITADKDVAVKWSGAESEILYLRFKPARGSTIQTRESETWEVWARSKSGKIFIVEYWLNKDLQVAGGMGFKRSTPEELLNVLLSDKKTDLIEKLKFPVKPA